MNSIRNVLWSLGGLGLRTVVQVVYFVLLARVLGPQEYGALSSALAIVYIFVPYATWGAGDILVKNVSRNRKLFGEFWGSALLSILIFGSIFLVLALFCYSLLLADKVSILPVILLCLSELFFLRIIDTTIQAYQAFERMSRTALVQFVFGLIRLLFTLLFVGLVENHSVTTWSILYLASTVTAAMFCLWIVKTELGKARFVFSHIRNNLREGFFFCLSPSSQSVYNDFDKSILPKFVSLEVTGNYSAAYKIIDALCVPLKALLQTFYARFFIKGADGVAAGRKLALRLLPVFVLYSAFAISFLLFFARYIPLLFGDLYHDAVSIILLLSPVILFRAIHSLGADALTGVGLQAKRSLLQVGVAILNAILCLILIPAKGWVGATWASLLSDGILALLIWMMIFSASETTPPLQKLLENNEPTPVTYGAE
jgi:O-antigen/teichoic acid export membrane protein